MATTDGDGKKMQELDDMTTCCICIDVYTDPKALPCIHTFCLKCIEDTGLKTDKRPGDEMPCPICRRLFKIPPEGFSGLPKNFFIENLIQITNVSRQPASSKALCDACLEENADAEKDIRAAAMFCVDCKQKYCEECSRQHSKFKLTKDHKLIEVNEYESGQTISQAHSVCELHEHKILDVYCADCKTIVCAICFIDGHKHHSGSHVSKFANDFRKQIESNIQAMDACRSIAQTKQREFLEVKEDIQEKVVKLECVITNRTDELKQLIDKHATSMLQCLSSLRQNKLKETKMATDDVDTYLLCLETCNSYCQNILAKGSASDICSASSNLSSRVMELQNECQPMTKRKIQSIDLCFRKSELEHFLQENCDNLVGKIEEIVPTAVQIALSSFEERKSVIINREISRLQDATRNLNGLLVSLELPPAIENLASFKEKTVKVLTMGGIEHLTALNIDLPALFQQNEDIFAESERALNEEEVSDRQLRAQFRQNWTRTPSEVLNQPIRQEFTKYRKMINSAQQTDSVLKERYFKNRDAIALLSHPDTSIEHTLLSGNELDQLQASPVVMTLMDQVREIKEERDVLEGQLKEVKCDMISKFLTALAQDGAFDEQSLSLEQLDIIYGPLKERVAQSLQKQDAVISGVQKNHSEFHRLKVQSKAVVGRDYKLKELESSLDSFIQMKENIDEGKKFYNDLAQILLKCQSKVNKFCLARNTEKDELLKYFSAHLSNQAASPLPQPSVPQQRQLYSNISVTRMPSSYGPAASPASVLFSPALPRSLNPNSPFSVGSRLYGAHQWR